LGRGDDIPMIIFTHEEKLLLKWSLEQTKSSHDPESFKFLMLKLDKMLLEDGTWLVLAPVPSFRD
jgi:hypothetical protein